MDGDGPITYFNNCHCRDYVSIYEKRGAFYDLDTEGIQARQATDLQPGQKCVVATPTPEGKIAFDWYSFQREEVLPDDRGLKSRVLFGRLLQTESMSKQKAARSRKYAALFNVNGHCKRQSVITRLA